MAAGKLQNAANLFADAGAPTASPAGSIANSLFGIQGYWYCDLLLSQMQAAAALRERASRTLQFARKKHFVRFNRRS